MVTTTRSKADFNPATHETRIAELEKDGGGGAVQIPINAIEDGTGIKTPIVEIATTPLGLTWERSALYVPTSAREYTITVGSKWGEIFGYHNGNLIGSINRNEWGSDAADTLDEITCRFGLSSALFSISSTKGGRWDDSSFIWIKALNTDLPIVKLSYQTDPWGKGVYGLSMADALSTQWGAYFKANVNKTLSIALSIEEPINDDETEILRVKTSNIIDDFALEVSSGGIKHRGKRVLTEDDIVITQSQFNDILSRLAELETPAR